MTKKRRIFFIGTVMLILIILFIGPVDLFVHGFFYDVVEYDQIGEAGQGEKIHLASRDYEMRFSPIDKHFSGFLIYLVGQLDENAGFLILTVLKEDGREIDKITLDLSKMKGSEWYKVYTKASFVKGNVYTLKIHAEDCKKDPCLQMVDADYLPEERQSGNALIGYAYADSTFNFQNKVLIIMLLLSIWGILCTTVVEKRKKEIKNFSVFLFLVVILSWNDMYNTMNYQNTTFEGFQKESEALVTSVIKAEQNAVYFCEDEEEGYGLGGYYDVNGMISSYEGTFLSEGDWTEGYSRTNSAIIVNSNIYTRNVAVAGNYVQFENGDFFKIKEIQDDGGNLIICLEEDVRLNSDKYGDLNKLRFYNADKNQLDSGLLMAYKSQYGLQGKIFRYMARYMRQEETFVNLKLICCLATAIVLTALVFLLAEKYNKLMAGVFFFTFWLSPWITNFAGNLYWVEFTWFLPMLAGLFCAWKIHNRKCKRISYFIAFLTVMIKCLCGYEYISAIMLGMIAFLFVDFIQAVLQRNEKNAMLLFRTIFTIGMMAIVGFVAAIFIHAFLRGNGELVKGIKDIFEQDVLRRTKGGDFNLFSEIYWDSFNASAWETISQYFHFSTEIIVGIQGNLFPLLCIIPVCIFMYDFRRKQLNTEAVGMYMVSFFIPVSWFYLAKAHSYVHTHINYVLWYFGFIQICFYVIVRKITEAFCGYKAGNRYKGERG